MKRLFALALLTFAMFAPLALSGCTEETKEPAKAAPANPNAGGEAGKEAPK